MLRKYNAIVIAISVGLSFSACKNDNSGSKNGLDTKDATTATGENAININGSIKGLNANQTVYLDKISNAASPVSLMSVQTKEDGSFSFTTTAQFPVIYRIRTGIALLPLIVSKPGNINISGDIKDLNNYNAEGAPDIDYLKPLFKQNRPIADAEIATFIDTCKSTIASWYIVRMINPTQGNNLDLYKKVKDRMVKEYPSSEYTQGLASAINQAEAVVNAQPIRMGMAPPDISLPSPQGKTISLSSLKGKVVLLDFWASWCGPCRKTNPELVAIYNELKGKGFTVYSVSLDKEKKSWVQAIAQDNLTWENHVSELKYWYGEVSQLYGVNSIPATFLLDKEGKIVAKDLHGEALKQKIKSLL